MPAIFEDVYPTMNDMREDMITTICNITDTKAEANALIKTMDSYIEQGYTIRKVYDAINNEIKTYLERIEL